MLSKGLFRITLGMSVCALMTLGGCRSASKDRIRVLEAEKADASRREAELKNQNARLRGDVVQAEGRAQTAAERAKSAEDRLKLALERLQSDPVPPSQPAATVDGRAIAEQLGGVEGVKVNARADGATIVLSSDVNFRSGQADLSKAAETALKRVASVLQSSAGVTQIRIEGHTDSDPIRKSGWTNNEELSRARAERVQAFLLNQGVSADMLSIAGSGAARPVAPNSTAQGKAANRRVEIIVLGS